MRLWQSATFVLWWVTVCLFTTPVSAQTLRLEVRAPEEFSGIARQIRNYDPNPLLETPWLSDVRGLAAPILVELVTESVIEGFERHLVINDSGPGKSSAVGKAPRPLNRNR